MRAFGWLSALFLMALAPLVAIGQTSPQVAFATPGASGGNAGAINRFTIRFSEAMVPLGDPRAKAPAQIKCVVPSAGRWIDQQAYVFEFERPLPGGISCKISLRDGLKSARGALVTGTTEFKIDTGGPSARSVFAGTDDDAIEEDQVFLVATNTPATPQSIATWGYCAIDGVGERIPLDVLGNQAASNLLAQLGKNSWSARNFLENAGLPQTVSTNATERAKALETVTAVKCRRPLPPGKNVALVWGKNIANSAGRVAGKDERFDYSVRKAFVARWQCRRVNAQSGCSPIEDARLVFTADVPVAQAMAARLVLPDGSERKPRMDSDDKGQSEISRVIFAGPLPAATKVRVTIPANFRDFSGRPLQNALRFPLEVPISAPPPLVKFPANFGIIEANADAVLPVSVRAVEPALSQSLRSVTGEALRIDSSDLEIARWLRRVESHEATKSETIKGKTKGAPDIEINRTADTPLLPKGGTALKLDLPGQGKQFEVVGIPLRKPGFYVVELASPALGAALMRPGATRYVATAALVTNMAVHFKWGREGSLAWVTTLDGAKPVGGADVRVTDTCSGRQHARGISDASGRVMFASLPVPDTGLSQDCSRDVLHPLMISARANGDFSFTVSEWTEGIEPNDFEMRFGYYGPRDLVHAVLDRKLVKQGETVNMKFVARRPIGSGFAYGKAISGTLRLSHSGTETEFSMPVTIGSDGIGEASWAVPKGAPMGTYRLTISRSRGSKRTGGGSATDDSEAAGAAAAAGSDALAGANDISLDQDITVDEYRLPTMRATITGPKDALVKPARVPLSLYVGFLSGGAAGNMPVNIRTAYSERSWSSDDWEGWSFGGDPVVEGTVALNGENQPDGPPMPLAQTLPLTLAGDGTARAQIDLQRPIDRETAMDIEMDYQDANGETLTTSRRILLHPASLRLGIKSDGWMMRGDDLRLKMVALDLQGKPMRGRSVKVEVYSRETLTARRRLIGGFYAYDNQQKTTRLGASCAASTDAQGLAGCTLAPGVSGEVTVVATTTDNDGNVARAVSTVWLAGADDWWFGGDNGDRMDVVAEAKQYKAGDTAKLQVRMPFREATALVTVEREGVLSSYVTQLSGKDPTIEVKLPGSYAPNVYVSVMAVRGRVGGFKLWSAQIARDWGLPFLSKDGYEPTGLVDLAKPSYRIGMAKLKVGWEGHQLGVDVKADRQKYGVGETANVDVAVKAQGGRAPQSAEIAFAAVDEALLQLKGNDSWELIEAMMGERPTNVLTSTAQMQVVGKRHYGKKAVAAGGGGGADPAAYTRNDFRPVLLWKGRVALDDNGHAQVPVKLADSLSSYKLVAVANAGADQFGTGSTTIRTAQDLSVFAGLPPLVRSGDTYGASFTLRNTTDKTVVLTATAKATGVEGLEPKKITVPAGGAVPVTWQVKAPDNVSKIDWVVDVKGGKASDRVAISQDVVPAVPVETWAGTLLRIGANTSLPIEAPTGALPGLGYVDVRLSDSLAPPLTGVRDYMLAYPYNCFEQKTSRIVTLDDAAGWAKLASDIPAYLDNDGLLRYWPYPDMKGSTELTAYILSITAEAGYKIPTPSRAKMLAAMKNVLDGRLKRNRDGPQSDQFLKVAAVGALARQGASTNAMLGQIALAPSDMPTGVLADWLITIDRTKGANPALRSAAEAQLRQRVVYEGTRLDLVDGDKAPWWMMASYDEMAIKGLYAVLGRPGWSAEDQARMMIGVATRQWRGHWDLTTANAWGAIATRRFAKLYPASAITGVTTVALAGVSKQESWPRSGAGEGFQLPLPVTKAPLVMNHATAGPWANILVKAAVPLKEPLFAGYRIKKEFIPIEQARKGAWTQGDVMKVRLTVDAGAARSWVVVNDPIPPGATVLGGLGGQSAQLASKAEGDGWSPSYVERGNDSWRGFYDWMPEGQFKVEYVVRLNGTGQFTLPPTRVEAMYSPSIRGQLPNGAFSVAMK